ncbi:NAD(P)H-dependent glycerol-3-phosphate dehydrogenase [Sphingobacterium corticibacterium]|uniref:Glycerol-3-phosphate dehydrogenase n=1 Tax=Sphingobacterium corticibacterium TaxID=2484746 RepID=A0A4V2DCK1_9SPHI|nr:NAD(P)H-dependent glycerol-3-phosphate dehydrogenase [Sphingobacterium corticibacterium]RZF61768.1 glycerol-3-phosphate dehydrogenase [Sphingobacterium corticibacterium]
MEISVIGGGSWATALVKILTENKVNVSWYLRRKEQVNMINADGVNPDYLTFVRLNTAYLKASTDLAEVIQQTNKILFVVPSAHFPSVCSQIDSDLIQDKSVITSIKGTVGPDNDLPSAYIANRFKISENKQAILAGPCHAEEIAMGKKTYMTIGSPNEVLLRNLKPYFERFYLQVNVSDDSVGMEYAAIFKNVIGLVCGIAKGLNYGDNFIAVLVSNAIYELEQLLKSVHVNAKRIACSGYLGDLLVTGYSSHSRNRTFGELIGRGYSVEQTQRLMSMVAEGYGATKGIYQTAKELGLNLPIVNTAYRILYRHMSAAAEFKLLERNMI